MIEPTAASRLDEVLAQAAEHHRDAEAAGVSRRAGGLRPLPPDALYLTAKEWRAASKRRLTPLPGDEPSLVPHFHAAPNAKKRFAAFVAERAAAGHRVVLAGATPRDLATLAKAAGREADAAEGWSEVEGAEPGAVLTLALSAEHGFVDDGGKLTMVCAADLLGHAAHRADHHHHHAVPVPWHAGDGDFAIGDTVIHIDHGVGVLRAIETIASEAAGSRDTVRLDYAKDADLLAPVEALDLLWRYGGAGDAIRLDRLDDGSWSKRRQRIWGEIALAARALVALARKREETQAAVLEAPADRYRAFAARFPFPPTPDQGDAIAAVIADLASGRPMDRLVVGDVGFGKTEVALRAAAVAALAGRQVALVAPTTVLVRQHVATFTKRFAELGIGVAQLSRLDPARRSEGGEGRPRRRHGPHRGRHPGGRGGGCGVQGARPPDGRRGAALRRGREGAPARARRRRPRPDPHRHPHPPHPAGRAGGAAGPQRHRDAAGAAPAHPHPGGALRPRHHAGRAAAREGARRAELRHRAPHRGAGAHGPGARRSLPGTGRAVGPRPHGAR